MIGVGIDLVDIKKLASLIGQGDFLQRCFCSSELDSYKENNRLTYLAGRYAVKEAVVKALGTGLIDGLSLTDVEVVQLPSGAPALKLNNKAFSISNELGITKWLISISHTNDHATAIAIAI